MNVRIDEETGYPGVWSDDGMRIFQWDWDRRIPRVSSLWAWGIAASTKRRLFSEMADLYVRERFDVRRTVNGAAVAKTHPVQIVDRRESSGGVFVGRGTDLRTVERFRDLPGHVIRALKMRVDACFEEPKLNVTVRGYTAAGALVAWTFRSTPTNPLDGYRIVREAQQAGLVVYEVIVGRVRFVFSRERERFGAAATHIVVLSNGVAIVKPSPEGDWYHPFVASVQEIRPTVANVGDVIHADAPRTGRICPKCNATGRWVNPRRASDVRRCFGCDGTGVEREPDALRRELAETQARIAELERAKADAERNRDAMRARLDAIATQLGDVEKERYAMGERLRRESERAKIDAAKRIEDLERQRFNLATQLDDAEKERDEARALWRKSHADVCKERDEACTRLEAVRRELDEWRKSHADVCKERDDLRSSWREALDQRDHARKERDQFRDERDAACRTASRRAHERDEARRQANDLFDEWRKAYGDARKERDELRAAMSEALRDLNRLVANMDGSAVRLVRRDLLDIVTDLNAAAEKFKP